MHCRIWIGIFFWKCSKTKCVETFISILWIFKISGLFLGENTVIIKILYNLSKSLPILGVGQHGGPYKEERWRETVDWSYNDM